MEVFRSINEWQEFRKNLEGQKTRIALVPTMGYLHEGHLQLLRQARERADFVVISIFVNPLQFNDPHDLATYPVDEKRDLKLCEQEGVDAVFMPARDEMFPDEGGPKIRMVAPELTDVLCGPGRPGHFEGVLTIVARLFHLIRPDVALFGKKDYQQYRILETMVREYNFPLELVGCETVREEDGLAMSSRNARLDPAAREQAPLIFRALKLGKKAVSEKNRLVSELKEIVREVIETGSLNRVEYVEVVDPVTLHPMEEVTRELSYLLAVAVFCGGVRLIDNLEVSGD